MSVLVKQFMFHNEYIGKDSLCFIMSVSIKQFTFHNEYIGKKIYVS